jgi:hypothetical protein
MLGTQSICNLQNRNNASITAGSLAKKADAVKKIFL